MEIDHLFVLCDANAPEADALSHVGLVEGSSNTHPGQGTACRRFFFRTSYLELLWVHDPTQARREPARRTQLWDRWSNRRSGACPFGVVLRPASQASDCRPPFGTWPYRPTYLPPGLSIDVALDAPVIEPAFFWLAFAQGRARSQPEPTSHRLGETISAVHIGVPFDTPCSEAARLTRDADLLSFETLGEHLLVLTLEEGARGETIDLRPTLPMQLRS
jgi:hypothetical protein